MKLLFTGDIFPANLHYTVGFGVASRFSNGVKNEWIESLREIFQDADLVVGNLESPVLESDRNVGEMSFAGSELFVQFLRQAGVKVVSIANNHILEHGREGFDSTLDILDRNGIACIGCARDIRSNLYIFDNGSVSVGVAAFNAIHDIENPGLYAEYTIHNVLQTLSEMDNAKIKIKCIIIHWGNEYIPIPASQQVRQARLFIDSGASMVIGSHPHVIQPVEQYHGGVIAYSLGNFLFDMTWSKQVKEAIVLQVDIRSTGEITHTVHPIRIGRNYIPALSRRYDSMFMFERAMKLFQLYVTVPEKVYEKKYKRTLQWVTGLERIRMKIFLLMNIFRMSGAARAAIVHRAIKRLSKTEQFKSLFREK